MKPELVLEVCWELSGDSSSINSSIKSRHLSLKNNSLLIGPYNNNLNEKPVPYSFIPAFDEMKRLGVKCTYGELYSSKAILMDYSGLMGQKERIKGELWKWFKIDSMHSKNDFNEAAVFGYSAGMLVERLLPSFDYKRGILHCQGWHSAPCLLYAKANKLKIASVFTAYSVALGNKLRNLGRSCNIKDASKESYKHNIEFIHQLEKEAALNADLFTANSTLTSLESEKLLGVKAAAILPQGFNFKGSLGIDELALKHNSSRLKLEDFAKYFFFPYYHFDLSNTVFVFFSDNYNPAVKSLSILNKRFSKLSLKVIAIFFSPAIAKGLKHEVLKNRESYSQLSAFIDDNLPRIRDSLVSSVISGNAQEDFSSELISAAKKSFMKKGTPPLSTHEIQYEGHDSLLNLFKKNSLLNKKSDNVKVILYPNSDNELMLKELLPGFDLGFSSSPIEFMALGIPSLTTNMEISRISNKIGKYIINKENLPESKSSELLANKLYGMIRQIKKDKPGLRLEAREISKDYSWENVDLGYARAYSAALNSRFSD